MLFFYFLIKKYTLPKNKIITLASKSNYTLPWYASDCLFIYSYLFEIILYNYKIIEIIILQK